MEYLVHHYEISERRACKLARQHRSTQRYAAMSAPEPRPVVVATRPAADEGEDEEPLYREAGYRDLPSGGGGIHAADDVEAARAAAEPFLQPAVYDQDEQGADGWTMAEDTDGPDTVCDAVVDTFHAVGRIPVTVVGGLVRYSVDSGTACVQGVRSTAALLGRLVPCGRGGARCFRR